MAVLSQNMIQRTTSRVGLPLAMGWLEKIQVERPREILLSRLLSFPIMAALPPPIRRPEAVLNNVINMPLQPSNPPTDEDVVRAAYYAKQVLEAHGGYNKSIIYNFYLAADQVLGRREVDTVDLAAALKYKATVIARANPGGLFLFNEIIAKLWIPRRRS